MDDEFFWLVEVEGIPRATYNDMWYKWLGDQGYTGVYTERWYKYAGDRGLTGALPDRLKKLFCEDLFNSPVTVWILEQGSWNDNARWVDSSSWEDS